MAWPVAMKYRTIATIICFDSNPSLNLAGCILFIGGYLSQTVASHTNKSYIYDDFEWYLTKAS